MSTIWRSRRDSTACGCLAIDVIFITTCDRNNTASRECQAASAKSAVTVLKTSPEPLGGGVRCAQVLALKSEMSAELTPPENRRRHELVESYLGCSRCRLAAEPRRGTGYEQLHCRRREGRDRGGAPRRNG